MDPDLLHKYRYASRPEKARKIIRILQDHLVDGDLSALRCLDLGCGIGVIAAQLADVFGQAIGLDSLAEPLSVAQHVNSLSQARFLQGDGLRLPFSDEAFDVIVCAQVYEHSICPHRLIAEIHRTLKPGGCCFFSGPNRLWPVEEHYGWVLLHWLPRAWLDRYCQSRYGHDYDLILYNYWQLRALWQGFEHIDYTLRLLYESDRFWDLPRAKRVARVVPRSLMSFLRFLLPNYNWMLVKRGP